jgi:hypothetical protein
MASRTIRALVLRGSVGVLFVGALGCGSSSSSTSGGRPGDGGSAQGGSGSGQGGTAGTQAGTTGVGGSASGSGGNGTGNAGSGSGGDAGAAGQPMTEEAVCRAVIQAQCEVKARCGTYRDLKHCMQLTELCPEYYFSPGSTRTVQSMASCLDAVRNLSCDENRVGINPPCLTPGTLEDDAPCTYSSQCVSGACVAAEGSSCTTCSPLPRAGEPCEGTFCAIGSFCDRLSGNCTVAPASPAAAEGEPCNVTSSPFVGCRGSLVCGPTASSAAACHVAPGEGEPCTPDFLCAPPFECIGTGSDSVCAVRDCYPGCPTGLGCVYQNGAYTCAMIGELGDACDGTLTPCASGLVCKNGACVEQGRRGEPCEAGDCSRVLTCTNGICSLPESACP